MRVSQFWEIPNQIQEAKEELKLLDEKHDRDKKILEKRIVELQLRQMGLELGQRRKISFALRQHIGSSANLYEVFEIAGIDKWVHGIYIKCIKAGSKAFMTIDELTLLLECEVVDGDT